jgi:hypothetical protein
MVRNCSLIFIQFFHFFLYLVELRKTYLTGAYLARVLWMPAIFGHFSTVGKIAGAK